MAYHEKTRVIKIKVRAKGKRGTAGRFGKKNLERKKVEHY